MKEVVEGVVTRLQSCVTAMLSEVKTRCATFPRLPSGDGHPWAFSNAPVHQHEWSRERGM